MANGITEKTQSWMKDSCELARRNYEKTIVFDKALDTLKHSQNEEMKAIGLALENLRDRYANRLPAYGTAIIAGLSTVCGVLATLLIKGA